MMMSAKCQYIFNFFYVILQLMKNSVPQGQVSVTTIQEEIGGDQKIMQLAISQFCLKRKIVSRKNKQY